MVFDLLEFNKKKYYYGWLVTRRPSWDDNRGMPTWIAENRWPTWSEKREPVIALCIHGVKINKQDYLTRPPLNRKCHEGNIHQTILAEYDTWCPFDTYLELYFRLYHSISKRIILKITRKGLEDAKNKKYHEKNISQTIMSYLPSGLPVDADGMSKMAKERLVRRAQKRWEEQAQLQKEKDLMELSQCLICRGIELVLKTSELKDDTQQGNAINDGIETYKTSENWKRRGKKRRRLEGDKRRANRMAAVKLIYLKVQEFK